MSKKSKQQSDQENNLLVTEGSTTEQILNGVAPITSKAIQSFINSPEYALLLEDNRIYKIWKSKKTDLETSIRTHKDELTNLSNQLAELDRKLTTNDLSLVEINELYTSQSQLDIQCKSLKLYLDNTEKALNTHENSFDTEIPSHTREVYKLIYKKLYNEAFLLIEPYIDILIACKQKMSRFELDPADCNIKFSVVETESFERITKELDDYLPTNPVWYYKPLLGMGLIR